jgi:cupin fold WbuC family metalloprotein
MLAFPNVSGPVFRLTEEMLTQGFAASRESPRRRIILPLHRTQDAPVQRMLNFFQPGTYVRPHVHPMPGQTELVQVMRGRLGFLLFSDTGELTGTHDLVAGPDALIDIEAGQWHGMICLAPDTVIVEIKRGPYSATMDKTFATWAPDEGAPEASERLEAWSKLFPGEPGCGC